MEAILTSYKTDVTTVEFFPLKRYPHALWLIQSLNGVKVHEGAVPRHVVERQDPKKLAEFYSTRLPMGDGKERSLPKNAIFWPVPKADLSNAEAELWPKLPLRVEDAESPDFVLLYKSGWDHSTWGIDCKPLMAPLRLTIWGRDYHLRRLGEHLTTKFAQHFSDFEIEPNRVWQNHDISGRSLGHVTFDPTGFDFPKGSSRSISWCEEQFFRIPSYGKSEYDPFGVQEFVIPENKR